MVVDFTQINPNEKPILILKNLSGKPIQTLGYAFNVKLEGMYNEVSTLTFDLPAYIDGSPTPHYTDVTGMKVIDLKGYGQFILIDPEETGEDNKTIKSCKAYSLEYELAKKNITIENGTYNFYSTTDAGVVNPDSIIGRILEKVPDWTAEVDTSLINKYRTFEVSEQKVYDFIKNTVQKTYGCIFEFDTYKRHIKVVSVDTKPELSPIYLSQERLIKKIDIEEDSDSVITCLDVNGAEGVTIRSVNPTGTNKIYNLDHFMTEENFSAEMIEKWGSWKKTFDDNQQLYYDITIDINLRTAKLLTYQSELANLKNELTSWQNVQASHFEANFQGLYSENEYTTKINDANSKIDGLEIAIPEKESEISSVELEIQELNDDLKDIINKTRLDNYFTTEEYGLLQRYFIEDSLQDESFVTTSTKTYDNKDISNDLNNVTVKIDNSEVTSISGSDTKEIYKATGGKLILSAYDTKKETDVVVFSAELVSGIIEFNSNNNENSYVFTAYLNKGIVGESNFVSGTITSVGSFDDNSIEFTQEFTEGSLEFFIPDGSLYFTQNTSAYEKQAVEWDLFKYGESVLKEKSQPVYTFSIEAGNFLALDEFTALKNNFGLGKRVYLNIDGDIKNPYVIGFEIDFEDPSSLSIEFCNTYSTADSSFKLAQLLEQSVSMGKSLNAKSGMYSEFVNSGASSAVKTFMDSALDIAKNTVMSSGSQAIEFGDAGIRIRKWAYDENGNKNGYEPEQIWMVDNMIAFTTDNWTSAQMAIGKIFDPNMHVKVDKDAVYNASVSYYTCDNSGAYHPYTYNELTWETDRENLYIQGATLYGIAAPYLVGTLLAGSNLQIATDNGSFRVDESGVYIDSLKFYITHNKGSENEYSTSIEDALGNISTVTTYRQSVLPDNPIEGDLWYNIGIRAKNISLTDDTNGATLLFNTSIKPTVSDFSASGTNYIIGTNTGDIRSDVLLSGNLITLSCKTDDGYITVYENGEWLYNSIKLSSNMGGTEYVDTSNPFYIAIYLQDNSSELTSFNDYEPNKTYRYNGQTWELLEDGDIEKISQSVGALDETVSNVLTEDGNFLKAESLSGLISAAQAKMANGGGNVLFDENGLWLLGKNATKDTATQAVWMNETGILFGSGSAGKIVDTDEVESDWKWTTAISRNGVYATEIIGKLLSGYEITGGSLEIGKNGSGYYLTVDDTGATFNGTVQADDFLDSNGNSMIDKNTYQFNPNYLNLKGLTITDGTNTSIKIDENGVVLLGPGCVISWNGSNTAISNVLTSINSTAETASDDAAGAVTAAQNAENEVYKLAFGMYGVEDSPEATFIQGRKIESPVIEAGLFVGGVFAGLGASYENGVSESDALFYGGKFLSPSGGGHLYIDDSSITGCVDILFKREDDSHIFTIGDYSDNATISLLGAEILKWSSNDESLYTFNNWTFGSSDSTPTIDFTNAVVKFNSANVEGIEASGEPQPAVFG